MKTIFKTFLYAFAAGLMFVSCTKDNGGNNGDNNGGNGGNGDGDNTQTTTRSYTLDYWGYNVNSNDDQKEAEQIIKIVCDAQRADGTLGTFTESIEKPESPDVITELNEKAYYSAQAKLANFNYEEALKNIDFTITNKGDLTIIYKLLDKDRKLIYEIRYTLTKDDYNPGN